MILYLHGFRSSPLSFKSRLIAARMRSLGRESQFQAPQLPASPREAIMMATALMQGCPPEKLTLIGSSLGGYYATWLAEQAGCRAVLLNPAVKPPRDLEKYVGVTTAYHTNDRFEFRHEHVDELKSFAVDKITRPERYFLLAATGDEVFDWREMVAHYPGATQRVIEGSDHGISDFAAYLDEVLGFCGIDAGVPG